MDLNFHQKNLETKNGNMDRGIENVNSFHSM